MLRFLGRFLFWTGLLAVAGGVVMHYRLNIPEWVSNWLGNLPGDMWFKKGKLIIYFPIASAALVSILLSVLFSVVFKKSS